MRKKEQLNSDSVHDFEGSIDSVIARLQEKKAEFEKRGYEEITMEIVDCWGYYDDHWIEVNYYGIKMATVEEFIQGKESAIHAKHLKKRSNI